VTVAAGTDFNTTSCTGQGSNETTQASYTLDNAGPVVSATKSPAANTEGWNKDNVTVTWSATDAGLRGRHRPHAVVGHRDRQRQTRQDLHGH
jgi:hypothetical protein